MNNDFLINGIQQVGIGVENFHEAWKFYIDVFNMNIRILEDDTVAERMLPYTGNSPQKRHACIAINMQGGGGFEIWQYSERKPQYPDFEINLGDYGIFAAKIKSRNVKKTYEELHNKTGLKILTKITETIDGNLTFFVQDPWNNVFQICYDSYIFHDENRSTGGVIGAIIGVSDIEKALKVYSDILGYDKIIADKSGVFNDLIGLSSGNKTFRRVLLSHSAPRKGAFSQLFGPSYIELVQIQDSERQPRRIYENRFWGDPGFIQICFDVANMNNLKKHCAHQGFPFSVDSVSNDSSKSFDMGEAAGRFAYIEDPDGTLIELVETHKILLLKSLGIYLNLKKRNPQKPLPKWMLKFLKYGKVKLI